MKDEVEQALRPLVERALWAAGREGAMLWLQFGERSERETDPDGPEEIGEYALHVSCAWRLVGPEGIHAASGDYFTPADPSVEPEAFDWDGDEGNWCDVRLDAFIDATAASPRRVTSISADELGSVRVFLGDDFVLDVFPDSSHADHVETEFWRVLQPSTGESHFVVGSFGIDRVPGA